MVQEARRRLSPGAPLAAEPAEKHTFVTAFLSRWGEALSGAKHPQRRQ